MKSPRQFPRNRKAGRQLPVSLDEFTLDRGQRASHITGRRRRRAPPRKNLADVFPGGMLEFILGDLLKTDDFKTPERKKLWRYLWYARKFMEADLPFWESSPPTSWPATAAQSRSASVAGKPSRWGRRCLRSAARCIRLYLPTGSPSGTVDLADLKGFASQLWYNPRTGEFAARRRASPADRGTRSALLLLRPNLDWVRPHSQMAGDRHVRLRRQHSPLAKASRRESRGFRCCPINRRTRRPTSTRLSPTFFCSSERTGGWPKDYDMLAVLTDEQKAALRATHEKSGHVVRQS